MGGQNIFQGDMLPNEIVTWNKRIAFLYDLPILESWAIICKTPRKQSLVSQMVHCWKSNHNNFYENKMSDCTSHFVLSEKFAILLL